MWEKKKQKKNIHHAEVFFTDFSELFMASVDGKLPEFTADSAPLDPQSLHESEAHINKWASGQRAIKKCFEAPFKKR